MTDPQGPANPPSSPLKFVLGLSVVAILLFAAKFFNLQGAIRSLLDRIASLGPWVPAVFILAYILACVFFIPGSLLTLSAGVLFGVVRGSLCVSVGATLGGTAAFLIGRYLARGWVSRKIEAYPKFRAVDEAVAREGWKIVGLMRLSPVFPFNLLNYGFGVTRVSLRDYFFASWIGMMPGTVMYVYIGSLAGDLASIGSAHRTRTPAEWALYAVGFAATVALTLYITRIARKALEQRVA